MRFSLRQMEIFLATARLGNISQAADTLAMSQSAASEALRSLEAQFDVVLFDRVGKRLQLNAFGEAILPGAEALVMQARELEQQLSGQEPLGDLRVGATLSIGNYIAVELVARYMREHPGARVSLQVANTATIADQVAHFQLDVGLIEGEVRHPALDVIHWRSDELVVFAAPDHPLCRKRKLNDKDLVAADWIVREPGSGTRQTFERAMKGLLADLNLALELQHTEAIKRAVEAGLGIGCLSRVTLEEAFRRGSLVPLKVPHRDFSRSFYFILHKRKFRSSGVKTWLALCEQS